jgi:hypothetical protein
MNALRTGARRFLVDQMIARKRALFADDERLIGEWEVNANAGGHQRPR